MRHSIVDRDSDGYYLALIEGPKTDVWAKTYEAALADVTQAILDEVAPRHPKHRAQSAHEMKEAEEKGPGSNRTPPTRGNSNA